LRNSANPVDQNTLLAVSKADKPGDPQVFISSSQLPQSVGISQNFSVCEPASDTYTVTRFESQPSASPSPGNSATVALAAPTPIQSTTKNPCFGICSTPAAGASPTCLLCQQTTPLLVIN
jgi:hypothetical protein